MQAKTARAGENLEAVGGIHVRLECFECRGDGAVSTAVGRRLDEGHDEVVCDRALARVAELDERGEGFWMTGRRQIHRRAVLGIRKLELAYRSDDVAMGFH